MASPREKGLRWYRPVPDRFWEWSLLSSFGILFGFQLVFTTIWLIRGVSVDTDRFLVGETFISILVAVFLAWFLVERAENRLKEATYMLRVDGPFDGVIERTLEVLGLLDIPYSQGYGPKVRPMYARLYGYQVSSYDVEAGGYRVLLEHRPADGTAPDEGITFLRTGPIGPANHARILQFVESYNALADEVKGPELVVWTERSRRRPANAGEGFNSSGTVTSDAEEEVR